MSNFIPFFSPYLAITFSASLDINTPELNEYLYSRQAGRVVEVYANESDIVNNGSPLILFLSEGVQNFIYSSVDGKVIYRSELSKGSSFKQGELLFKIKNDEIYGILELSEGHMLKPVLAIGTSLCAETYNSSLKVIKVNKKTILVSIKTDYIEALRGTGRDIHNFKICNEWIVVEVFR